MKREAFIKRETRETAIRLYLDLDGGSYGEEAAARMVKNESGRRIDSGCGFLNHMLELLSAHGGMGLELSCRGDIEVDYHHTVEDCAIALGEALRQALGDKRGICRYGSQLLPMDEALVLVALDISGRSFLVYDVEIGPEKVGDFDCELAEEFMQALARSAGVTLHIKKLSGHNAHHIIEAMFKGLGRALSQAVKLDESRRGELPSTKGMI